MQNLNEPILIIEIKANEIVFTHGYMDDQLIFNNYDITILDNINFYGLLRTNSDDLKRIIINKIESIEKKLDFTFKKLILIFYNDSIVCANVSTKKKLSGSKISKDDISFLINSAKTEILSKNKKLCHTFNLNFIIDKKNQSNPPIGLNADNLINHTSFCLIDNSIYEKIKNVFSQCNLDIEKIYLSNFIKGAKKIKKNEIINNFFYIEIDKEYSQIYKFENNSLRFSQYFNFGTKMILKDLSFILKISIDESLIILNNFFHNDGKESISFRNRNFKLDLITKIITSRAEELIQIIYKTNNNLLSIKKQNNFIYIELSKDFNNQKIHKIIKTIFSDQETLEFSKITQDELYNNSLIAMEIYSRGWDTEAIPVIVEKKSPISRLFSYFFK